MGAGLATHPTASQRLCRARVGAQCNVHHVMLVVSEVNVVEGCQALQPLLRRSQNSSAHVRPRGSGNERRTQGVADPESYFDVSAPGLSARRPCECDLSCCCWLHEFTRLFYLFSSGTALTYRSKVHLCGEDAASTFESRQTSSVCENVIARAGSSRPRSMSARRLADTISECSEMPGA